VNFGIYLVAIAAFAFFLDELMRRDDGDEAGRVRVAETPFRLAAWAMFLWSSLHWIRLRGLNPDMAVAAVVYVAAALLMRIRRRRGGVRTMIALGALLGVGYLTKATMFPLAGLFIAFAALDVRDWRRTATLFCAGVVAFAAVSAPFIAALSSQKGRLTFSDSGRIHYAWYVNGVRFSHWRGEPPGHGTPKHPTRQIFDDPEIFEFAAPVGGTFPEWYDPSYWYDGVTPRYVDGPGILRILDETSRHYLAFFRLKTFLVTALAVAASLVLARRSGQRLRRAASTHWPFLLIALAVFSIYSILNVEIRRIAPFVVLCWLGLLAPLRFRAGGDARAAAAVMTALAVFLTLALAGTAVRPATAAVRDVVRGESRTPHAQWLVADGLKAMGLRESDRIGFVGDGNRVWWARLARVKVIARLEDRERFWRAAPDTRARALAAFGKAGATIAVTHDAPPQALADGWRRVGATTYYAMPLGGPPK